MRVRLSHPTEISRRSPPDRGIRVVCGPMTPLSAGATTATVRLTHPTEISRRSPPEIIIRVGCGADDTIVCWGDNRFGEADPPDGDFTAVTTGARHSCGLRADRVIVCWGYNHHGQAEPPNKLTAVTTGHRHSCGLRGRWHHRLLGRQQIRGPGWATRRVHGGLRRIRTFVWFGGRWHHRLLGPKRRGSGLPTQRKFHGGLRRISSFVWFGGRWGHRLLGLECPRPG